MRRTIRIRHLAFVGIVTMLYAGCAVPVPVPEAPLPADMGGAVTRGILNLPFADSVSALCTQGNDGDYSHDFRSTRYAVDLDTPNDRDQAVYAPSSGVARVHDDPASPFGIHVNVDRLDGTYTLSAHLKRAIVRDGAEVSEGTLIGIEGCTGACTGDHVHLALMEGDASQDAGRGLSVTMSLLLRLPGGEMDLVDAADLACGLEDGARYASALAAVSRHPDGTLVQVPGDPRVYQLDGGAARHIVDEAAFHGLGYDFEDVVLVASEELSCYEQGTAIASGADLAWSPVPGLTVGTLVREASKSDVYAVSAFGLMPVDEWRTLLLLGYDSARIRFVADGTLAASGLPMGDCVSGFGCVTRAKMSTCAAALTFGAAEDGGIGGPGDGESVSDGPQDEEEEEHDDGSDDGSADGGGTPPADDPDAGPAPDGNDEDGTPSGNDGGTRTLHVSWQTPFQATATRITLSGEYRFADGSYGFPWHELEEVSDASTVDYALTGVGSGDTLRFSVEFVRADGSMSWSCIAPYDASQGLYGTRQGIASADVDGEDVPVVNADDPTSDGCGLILTVP